MQNNLENGLRDNGDPAVELEDTTAVKPSTSGSAALSSSLANSMWLTTFTINDWPSPSTDVACPAFPASDTRPSSPLSVAVPLFPSSFAASTLSSRNVASVLRSRMAAATTSWSISLPTASSGIIVAPTIIPSFSAPTTLAIVPARAFSLTEAVTTIPSSGAVPTTTASVVGPSFSERDISPTFPSRDAMPWHPSYRTSRLSESVPSSQLRRESSKHKEKKAPRKLKKSLRLVCHGCAKGLRSTLFLQEAGMNEQIIREDNKAFDDDRSECTSLEMAADAVMFGIQNCQQILKRYYFTIVTSHESLIRIFGPQRPIPGVFDPRYTNFAKELKSYDYDIVYEPADPEESHTHP